ncbi:MAG: hypothetical protein R3B93_06335 [Bacteroidia bacterium]
MKIGDNRNIIVFSSQFMSNASLISTIISTASAVIAMIMLFLTRQDMNRRERKDQEVFINGVYNNFQEIMISLVQDSNSLEILAEEFDQDKKVLLKQVITSILINTAANNYRLYTKKLISQEQWEAFERDIKASFSKPFILDRWLKMRTYFPNDFQTFIDDHIVKK